MTERVRHTFGWLGEVGISNFLDIIVMALLIYALLVWFKKRRAAFVLLGIVIVAALYLLTLQFNLVMTANVFKQFFAVFLIALVIIFREELKDFFEDIAVWSINRRFGRRLVPSVTREEAEVLTRTLTDLAREKIGALVVLRGKELIARHLEGGVDLNGEMSEPLLRSIFDPHSAGHDGAVVIENGKHIAQFACHLPLSKNFKELGKGGTRHAAALGLSEFSDALCLVVSEERGTVSAARHGKLEDVSNPEKLTKVLERFYSEITPRGAKPVWSDFVKHNYREKIIAVALSFAVWFELVHGAEFTYKTLSVPVTVAPFPNGWLIDEMEPRELDVTFRAPRRVFHFMPRERVRLLLTPKLKEGDQSVKITTGHFALPEGLELESVEPEEVRVRLKNPSKSSNKQKLL